MLGLRHALRNEWPQAAGCYGEAIELDQFDGWKANIADQLSRAVSLAEAGDTTGYEQYCLEEAARFNPTDSIMISDWMLKSCLLMPADGKLLAALAPLAQAAGSPFVGAWEPRLLSFCDGWRSVSLGLLEYRAGDFAKSVDWCRHCLSMPIPVAPRTASARLILAMSLHEIGQDDEARSDLQQARTTVEGEFAHPLPPHPVAEQGMWFDWIIARRLLREATAVFAAGPTQAAPTPQLPSPDP
jgi:tetratricopeptide (TPR) repeat protein